MFYIITDLLLIFFHSFHYVFSLHGSKLRNILTVIVLFEHCPKMSNPMHPQAISALLQSAGRISGCLTYGFDFRRSSIR